MLNKIQNYLKITKRSIPDFKASETGLNKFALPVQIKANVYQKILRAY